GGIRFRGRGWGGGFCARKRKLQCHPELRRPSTGSGRPELVEGRGATLERVHGSTELTMTPFRPGSLILCCQ
ncbi:MAG: hypothetical protein AAB728_01180, partial [Patescibacteria group bacterium]